MQGASTSSSAEYREQSFFEYLSPFGVISTKEFIYRLLSFVGLLFMSVFLVPSTSIVSKYLMNLGYLSAAYWITAICIALALLLLWFLLVTLTKEYRTSGMPLPFIFASLTPILPFFFILKYLLSSRIKREENYALAVNQARYRAEVKAQMHKKRQIDKD